MRKVLLACCLSTLFVSAYPDDRFGRPVVKVKESKDYQFIRLDDVNYPTISNARFAVSCIVYRGAQNYYVEVSVKNNTGAPVALPTSFLAFDKPGYSVYRGDTMLAAQQAAGASGQRFVPVPPPYVPPTYNTTINGTATTNGNQTTINGTSTTTPDYSGQAGANLGNAIGNAIAAHRFVKAQRTEAAFSTFLAQHAQTDADTPLEPGKSRTIVAVFQQAKQKKKPFEISVRVGEDTFHFDYKE